MIADESEHTALLSNGKPTFSSSDVSSPSKHVSHHAWEITVAILFISFAFLSFSTLIGILSYIHTQSLTTTTQEGIYENGKFLNLDELVVLSPLGAFTTTVMIGVEIAAGVVTLVLAAITLGLKFRRNSQLHLITYVAAMVSVVMMAVTVSLIESTMMPLKHHGVYFQVIQWESVSVSVCLALAVLSLIGLMITLFRRTFRQRTIEMTILFHAAFGNMVLGVFGLTYGITALNCEELTTANYVLVYAQRGCSILVVLVSFLGLLLEFVPNYAPKQHAAYIVIFTFVSLVVLTGIAIWTFPSTINDDFGDPVGCFPYHMRAISIILLSTVILDMVICVCAKFVEDRVGKAAPPINEQKE